MEVFIDGKKLVKKTKPKSIGIDLLIKIKDSLEHDIEFIISRNESLTEYTIKNEIRQLLFKYGHEHKKRT